MNGMMDRLYQNRRFVEKQLEFAKGVLKRIAEARTETDLTDRTDGTDSAEADGDTREDRVELTREEMIEAAKNALAKLANGKDWK